MSRVLYEMGSLSWMLRCACRQAEAAKAVCSLYAVRANCLSYALEAMPEGIILASRPAPSTTATE